MSDFRSRVLGTIIGTLSRGSFPKREPVAFLYNGVRLPGLPVVEGFDKAYITKALSGEKYYLRFTSTPLGAKSGLLGMGLYSNGVAVKYRLYAYDANSDNDWVFVREGERAFDEDSFTLKWANTDVEAYDYITGAATGEIAMEASEPVPVYE